MTKVDRADIGWRSHWLQQALAEDDGLEPPLEGDARADVVIVGGGFLGLWTAIRLKEADPSLDVALLERDICGGGPSGRNSGMLLSAWTKFNAIAALRDEESAVALIDRSREAIDGIETFCAENGIDCWFDRVGWIWGATCAPQLGAWDGALGKLTRHGRQPAQPVSREQIAEMTGTRSHLAGVFDASAATIHPGHLVRGLRRAALRRGVRIYEKTRMRRFSRRDPIVVESERGHLRCGRLVLAMNAWSAAVPELAPGIFTISSDDAVSEPMPERLQAAGYSRGPLIIDSRVFVSGYRVTRDGRLLVGVTGGHVGFGGTIDARFDRPSPRVRAMREALREGHPTLADFPLANSWNGPIDRTASGLPFFGVLPSNPNIAFGYGFSGNGIGMTYLGGQIVTSLLTGRDDHWRESVLVRPVTRGFPREPFRFVGAHLVRGAVRRRDWLEHRDRKPGPFTRWLAGLAPSGVTPSKANIKRKEDAK
ncbi:FAD-dependent oxidoreductase [Mesorhizobium sp. YM1C-6-2]|uniref:FAD-dependent oxidoreductase n=1 Tax=Mesorhizobium sp. YM1C-6-2 TaxID=1827501 RepID=UPI000EF1BBF4|nr:FAD-dependent oxidoreductase [Mesorhizobium sp. YM1C-6-2]RLP25851.1 FAD-dependent oxidoreductase [Mesorhizobium sp. YM1C-6-2]